MEKAREKKPREREKDDTGTQRKTGMDGKVWSVVIWKE